MKKNPNTNEQLILSEIKFSSAEVKTYLESKSPPQPAKVSQAAVKAFEDALVFCVEYEKKKKRE